MNTATLQDSLRHLATQLQPALQSLFPEVPFQIRCARKQDQLLVLGQHPPGEAVDARQAIRILENTLYSLPATAIAQVFAPDSLPIPCVITLYLRALGQQRPYVAHRFEYRPPVVAKSKESLPTVPVSNLTPVPPPVSPPVEPVEESSSDVTVIQTGGESELVTAQPVELSPEINTTDVLQGWETSPPAPLEESAIELTSASSVEPSVAPASIELSDSFQQLLEPPSPASLLVEKRAAQRPAWLWPAALAGVSILGLMGGMAWVFSRPCGAGSCPPLEQAVQFDQRLPQQLQMVQSTSELEPIQQQLTTLTGQLSTIPGWSASHQPAQTFLQQYQTYSETIQQIKEAEAVAARANQKGQAMTQASTNWQSVKTLWQQAIAQLQAIPSTSPFYGLAQRRLTAFQQASRSATQALTTEEQATKQLNIAKSTAKLAETRQSTAKSLENWQLAQATWQVAVNTLQRIPKTATSYTEAQQLLATYQTKLVDVRGRTAQEKLSSNGYSQAMAQAQQAKTLEGQNQWSAATAAWQSALNSARQIPKGTFFYDQAQSLVATYEASLKLAESKLKAAVNLQEVQAELKKVCAGSPQTCTYTIANSLIRVQFTSAYERAARTAYIMGQGNASTLGGIMQHFDSLKAALQAISSNAGIPLEVYSSDNSLLGSFNP